MAYDNAFRRRCGYDRFSMQKSAFKNRVDNFEDRIIIWNCEMAVVYNNALRICEVSQIFSASQMLVENRVENFEARTRWIYGFRKTQNSSRNDLVICSLNSVAWYSSELRQRWDDVCMCSHESAPSRIINHAICFYKCWFIYIHICVYVYIITNTILRYHCTYFVFE